jgi:hypothetical protein
MLTGFNTDFKFRGTVYHVQTEDNGVANPVIVTLLYKGGAILTSRKISYADIVKSEHLDKIIKDLMESQHKQVIKDLVSGNFGAAEAVVDASRPAMPEPVVAEAVKPAAARPAAAAVAPVKPEAEKKPHSLDSIILDYLISEEQNG